MTTEFVYKLLTADDWQNAQNTGETAAAIDLQDGYVHLSTASQVAETASLHFNGAESARLLEFKVLSLTPLTWEESRGGQSFPHLYGPLEIAKADRMWTLQLDYGGSPIMPEDINAH